MTCSSCVVDVPKTLAVRTHRCAACGLVMDRDRNAARNVAARGWRDLRGLADRARAKAAQPA